MKQRKREKLTTPYNASPLTATKKQHSMITAENPNRRVTRNSSRFKKLLTDKPVTPSSDTLEEDTTELDTQRSSLSSTPEEDQEGTEIVTEPNPRMSTRVSVPPKRLVQEC